MSDLKEKVAIVTGGSRGIGRAIVLKLASLGCHVAFNYHQNEASAQSLEAEAKAFGVSCKGSKVDIKDFDGVKQWIDQTVADFVQLDILINNAGIIADKSLMMMTEQEWSDVINTDLNGMFNAARSCIVKFLKQKSGNIINISSISGIIGLVGQTNYSAAKGGVNAFTKALAKEVAPRGVRVNAIAPGYIETEILSKFSDEAKEKITKDIPLNRIGQCDDVANCVAFLLGDHAGYITGQVISIDGGLAMR